jgi:late competence protein required for DNA uptake (superfamily II DNA/RNA helicase)
MATSTAGKYRCARCGKPDTAENMLFSAFSRNRYCLDLDRCAIRAERRAPRKGEKQVTA